MHDNGIGYCFRPGIFIRGNGGYISYLYLGQKVTAFYLLSSPRATLFRSKYPYIHRCYMPNKESFELCLKWQGFTMN